MLTKYIREAQYLYPQLLPLVQSEGKITGYDDHATMVKAITKSLMGPIGLRKTGGSLGQGVYFWATTTDHIIRKLFIYPLCYIMSVSVLGVALCTQSKLQGLSTWLAKWPRWIWTKNDFKWTWTFKDGVNGNVGLLMSEGSCKPPQVLIDIVWKEASKTLNILACQEHHPQTWSIWQTNRDRQMEGDKYLCFNKWASITLS